MSKLEISASLPKNLIMSLLALYPVLGYYGTNVGVDLGQLLLFVAIIVVSLFSGFRFQKLPGLYLFYWGYAAIIYLMMADQFKVSLLVPGGVTLFVWSVLLCLLAPYFNLRLFKRYIRVIACISIVVFVLQELMFARYGYRFCAFIPISDSFYGKLTYNDLVFLHMSARRSPSLFLEPAYFGAFLLLVLSLELFTKDNQSAFSIFLSAVIVLTILWSASGSGILGLLVVGILWVLKVYKGKSKSMFFLLILFCIPIVVYGLNFYAQTEVGSSVLERQNEITDEDTSGFNRIVRGYQVFAAIPFIYKIIGAPFSVVVSAASSCGINLLEASWNFNGFQQVMVYYGLIGLGILIAFYAKLYNKYNITSQALIFILLYLSLVEYIYLAPVMFIITLFLISKENSNYNI